MTSRDQIESERNARNAIDAKLIIAWFISLNVTAALAISIIVEAALQFEYTQNLKLLIDTLLSAGVGATVVLGLIIIIRHVRQNPPLDFTQ